MLERGVEAERKPNYGRLFQFQVHEMKAIYIFLAYVTLSIRECFCFYSPSAQRVLTSFGVANPTFGAVVPVMSPSDTALLAMSNTNSKSQYDDKIAACSDVLNRAASTRNEDAEKVLAALEDLEKLYREKRKTEGETVAKQVLNNLNGSWRLVFTTGTKSTQERFQTRINYVPFKAIQSFNTTQEPFMIENGIYAWEFPVIKFTGFFQFDLRKSKVRPLLQFLFVCCIYNSLKYTTMLSNCTGSLNSTSIRYHLSGYLFH